MQYSRTSPGSPLPALLKPEFVVTLRTLLMSVRLPASTIGVGSVVLLLPAYAVASLPPETVTLFVTLAGAGDATLTSKLKVLVLPMAIAPVRVQVMTCPDAVQLQTVPPTVSGTTPAGTLRPLGKVSITVIVPEAWAVTFTVSLQTLIR